MHTFNILRHCHAELAHSVAEARRQKRCLEGQRARERSGMHEHVLNHMLIAFNMQTAARYMDRAIESDQRLWAGQVPSSRPGQQSRTRAIAGTRAKQQAMEKARTRGEGGSLWQAQQQRARPIETGQVKGEGKEQRRSKLPGQ